MIPKRNKLNSSKSKYKPKRNHKTNKNRKTGDVETKFTTLRLFLTKSNGFFNS